MWSYFLVVPSWWTHFSLWLMYFAGSFYWFFLRRIIRTFRKWLCFVFNGIHYCWRNRGLRLQAFCAYGYACWEESWSWYKSRSIHENILWWLLSIGSWNCVTGLYAHSVYLMTLLSWFMCFWILIKLLAELANCLFHQSNGQTLCFFSLCKISQFMRWRSVFVLLSCFIFKHLHLFWL